MRRRDDAPVPPTAPARLLPARGRSRAKNFLPRSTPTSFFILSDCSVILAIFLDLRVIFTAAMTNPSAAEGISAKTLSAKIVGASRQFPRHEAYTPDYGTAGFRTDAAYLDSTVFRYVSVGRSPRFAISGSLAPRPARARARIWQSVGWPQRAHPPFASPLHSSPPPPPSLPRSFSLSPTLADAAC